MNNTFKYIGISVFLIFSFYYTEKTNNILISNNSLFNTIKESSYIYEKDSINAVLDGNYIVPGMNGLEVHLLDSYYNMKEFNKFNDKYLKYSYVAPVISVDNNKDKIINRGNSAKRCVSIILKDNNNIIDYSYSVGLDFSRLVDINTFDDFYNYEQVNNEIENFNKLERRLNKKSNSNICVITDLNKKLCQNNDKYLVKPTLTLNNYNLKDIKKSIENGVIIYVDDNVKLIEYKLLLKQINYQDLKIVRLSKLINEERDC